MPRTRGPALVAAALTSLAAVALASGGSPATAKPVWSTTFTDDFEGTTLDTSRWTVGDTALNWNGIGAGACHQAGNVTVADGMLHLRSTVTAEPFTCQYPTGETFETRASNAEVHTKGRFQQAYGTWRIRARFPAEASQNATALWLYPAKSTFGTWPRSGEIDIAERMPWTSDHFYASLHYLDASRGTSYDPNDGDGNPGETVSCSVDTTRWHVYGVVWNRRQMTFTVDGRRCARLRWDPRNVSAPAPFDQPFFTILRQSAVVGAPGVRADRVALVDWVKVTR